MSGRGATGAEGMGALRLALLGQRARGAGLHRVPEPIAVIGMGCRFPGGADSPSRFWERLRSGYAAVREVPASRWSVADWFDPDPATPGKTSVKEGGFLDDVDLFDPQFFGITPREAERMDPHQRLSLEVAWETLEDSGLPLESVWEQSMGVFVASYNNDYVLHQYLRPEAINERTITGTVHSIVANRISHFLGVHGPSVTVDTACSASLVAVHLACRSLREGSSDLALVGGVSLALRPEPFVALSKAGFMSPDGRCKTFDARADGFGRGEGCGFVMLKRLADAVASGDRIDAVIRGSAVNQDGHSTILAAPNGRAQVEVIRLALEDGLVDPGQVGYIEAHGTGTRLGDPIEVESLAEALGRPATESRSIASVKSSIGHLEAAAGIAGLIKLVLCLRNGWIPPHAGFERENPLLRLKEHGFEIPLTGRPWPRSHGPRVGGVSSFGVGGTNAHIVVEEAPAGLSTPELPVHRFILPISAEHPEGLRTLCRQYSEMLENGADAGKLCRGAARGRTHRRGFRVAAVGDSAAALTSSLEAQAGKALQRVGSEAPPLCLVFSGQGTQWPGMGLATMRQEEVFAETLRRVDHAAKGMGGLSILDELSHPAGSSRLHRTDVAQVCLFAIQVALAEQLRHWGVRPRLVIGHSVGELAAAHTAGLLSLEEAVALVHARGRAMQEASGEGRMLSVRASEVDVQVLLQRHGLEVSLAAVNGPQSIVLSGATEAIEAARVALGAEGLECRLLDVRFAFHSPAMDAAARALGAEVSGLRARPSTIPLISTVDGLDVMTMDHAYVARNLRSTVRFADAIEEAARRGVRHFVEVGAHPVLGPDMVATVQTVTDEDCRTAYTLHAKRSPATTASDLLGTLYEWGVDPSWSQVYPGQYSVQDLPTYPWNHASYWLDGPGPEARGRPTSPAVSFPGRRLDSPAISGNAFELSALDPCIEALQDHRIGGGARLPATAIAELFRAAHEGAEGSGLPPVDISFLHAADIEPETLFQVIVSPEVPGASLHRQAPGAPWQMVARCSYRTVRSDEDEPPPPPPRGEAVSPQLFYGRMADSGCDFGPTFRLLEDIQVGDDWARANVSVGGRGPWKGPVHPAVVDACAQLGAVLLASRGEPSPGAFLPWAIDRYVVAGPMEGAVTGHVRMRRVTADGATFDVWALGPDGRTLAFLEGLHLTRAKRVPLQLQITSWMDTVPDSAPGGVSGSWLVAGAGDMLDAVASALRDAGASSVRRVGSESLAEASRVDCAGIVYALGLQDPTHGGRGGKSSLDGLGMLAQASSSCWPLLEWARGFAQSGRRPPPLLLLTRGIQPLAPFPRSSAPVAGSALGLLWAIRDELGEADVRALDLDPSPRANRLADEAAAVVNELTSRRSRTIAALRDDRRLETVDGPTALQPVRDTWETPVTLVHHGPGTLDGFVIEPQAEPTPPGPGQVLVRVLAAGVNFRDVLSSLGEVAGDGLGHECCGEVVGVGEGVVRLGRGDRVLVFSAGCFASSVTVPERATWPAPRRLDPVAAATIPIAFGTAWFALDHLASIESGDTVLIHAGAGGVGMAAIQIAKARGAVVYATAGSPEKRALIEAMGVAGAFDSRSPGFEDHVLAATGMKGVDVVVNSLTGEMIPAGLRCLRPGGIFIELGKREVLTDAQLTSLRSDVRYRAFDLREVTEADPKLFGSLMEPVCEAVEAGILRPLPAQVRPLHEAARALRGMSRAEHVGKVVLVPPGGESHDDGWAVVTGGTGALGVATVRWLLGRGRRRIAVASRSGAGGTLEAELRSWAEAYGATIRDLRADVTDLAALDEALRELRSVAPVTMVVHAAGVVDDSVLTGVRREAAESVMAPKIAGSWNLHLATLTDPIQSFLMYSAAGPRLDATGLAAYAAANGFLDALAVYRRGLGLPATSILWGPWEGEGMAARLEERHRKRWSQHGLLEWTPELGANALDAVLRSDAPVVFALRMRGGASPGVAGPRADRAATARLGETLRSLPARERPRAMVDHVMAAVRQLLGATSGVSAGQPLRDAGLDSLGAIELRNALTLATGESLPATLAFDHPTVSAIADYLLERLGLGTPVRGREPAATASDDVRSDLAAEVARLSEEDAEALLLMELDGGGHS